MVVFPKFNVEVLSSELVGFRPRLREWEQKWPFVTTVRRVQVAIPLHFWTLVDVNCPTCKSTPPVDAT